MRKISGKTGIAELVYQAAIPVLFIHIFHCLYSPFSVPVSKPFKPLLNTGGGFIVEVLYQILHIRIGLIYIPRLHGIVPVSYTHLDVYKRQVL